MTERCCAVWPTGERCDGLAVVDDPERGGYVCYHHAPAGARQAEAIRATIRRAMTHPGLAGRQKLVPPLGQHRGRHPQFATERIQSLAPEEAKDGFRLPP